jgi:DNA invertase Pin-like site-specific DNA recombinase
MNDTPKTKCTAAIYARVSTKDKGQDVTNQLIQLRDYCQRQGWQYVEYIDQASGKTGDRDAFKRLFADASRRLFDVVVVWALDRFTREGVLETFEYIRDLTRYGVQFESYTEAHFRTTGMAGELMLAITAWIAKQERLRITERVNAGIARARLHGTKSGAAIGRPHVVFDRAAVVELRGAGRSWREIAAALGVSTGTARTVFNSGVQKPIARAMTSGDAKHGVAAGA